MSFTRLQHQFGIKTCAESIFTFFQEIRYKKACYPEICDINAVSLLYDTLLPMSVLRV